MPPQRRRHLLAIARRLGLRTRAADSWGKRFRLCLLLGALLALPAGGRVAAAQPWRSIGPTGGTITQLVFAPSDSRIAYAGTSTNGVFRSDDGGASWSLAGAGLPAGPIDVLAVDPRHPLTAYASTGNTGIWKTVTGGAVWVGFPRRLAGPTVYSLTIDPTRTSRLYATTTSGLFRSDNGGRRWTAMGSGLPPGAWFADLAVDPAAPDHLLAALGEPAPTGFYVARVFKSRDAGASWTLLPVDGKTIGLPVAGNFTTDRTSGTLYLFFGGTDLEMSMFKSRDFGGSWSEAASLCCQGQVAASGSGNLYAFSTFSFSQSRVYKSEDGSRSWVPATQQAGSVTALAADPRVPDRVLIGTAGLGVLASGDGGNSWQDSSTGLIATDVTSIAVDPAQPSTLYASLSYGGGLRRSRDAGAHWRRIDLRLAPDLFADWMNLVAVNPGNPLDLYAAIGSNVAHSGNGGRRWSFAHVEDCANVNSLAVDPASRSVYAGGTDYVTHGCSLFCNAFVSRDSGASWGCLPLDEEIDAVALDPSRPSTLYAGGRHLWKSIDGGKSFGPPASGPQAVISLAVSPVDPRIVYAGTRDTGVFRSADAGQTWSPAATGLPAGAMASLIADPVQKATVYAGVSQQGAFLSRDEGATWQPLGEGLPLSGFGGKLALARDAHRHLYAATFATGAWALDLP
jgi:photosystem II stability/assembly factor-like uncharacterized protein